MASLTMTVNGGTGGTLYLHGVNAVTSSITYDGTITGVQMTHLILVLHLVVDMYLTDMKFIQIFQKAGMIPVIIQFQLEVQHIIIVLFI